MGGFNSGRHGGKRTTNDMRALDVRRVQRDGLLRPGHSFGWSWTRRGETIASINIKVDSGSVTLDYRNRPNGGEWLGSSGLASVQDGCSRSGSTNV